MKLQHKYSLRNLNTFGVDVRAAEYALFYNVSELTACLHQAMHTPWILGGGSNILFTQDIDRCVLHNAIGGIEIVEESTSHVMLRIGAGVVWHDLVTWCVDRDLGGIENLALIPGRVGAAPIQNIGAYGVELEDVFVSLRAMRLPNGTIDEFDNTACRFAYRDSVFKSEMKEQYCIIDIVLRLPKPPHALNTEYGAIRDVLASRKIDSAAIRDVYQAVIDIRSSKLPDPTVTGNAGSFFKNPVVDATIYNVLSAQHLQMPSYLSEDGSYKIPAGWLIEQCGWKGRRVGNVGCYEKQSLVIVNYGGASGSEIWDHALRVQESVRERFGIVMEPEVNVM